MVLSGGAAVSPDSRREDVIDFDDGASDDEPILHPPSMEDKWSKPKTKVSMRFC